MKLTKKNKIMIGAVSGVLTIAVIVTAVLLTGGNTLPVLTPESEPESSPSEIVVNLPTDTKQEAQTSESESTEKEDTLVVDVSGNPESPTDTDGNKNNDTAKSPEQPIETKKPEQPANDRDSGVIIGGGSNDEQEAIAQAWLRNLELEGCPYCNTHSCPSFYAKDEWGYPSLDVTLCPAYDILKDPIKYCQISGKKAGDGSNGTCVRFVNDCHCPNCDKFVKANACHTCDE